MSRFTKADFGAASHHPRSRNALTRSLAVVGALAVVAGGSLVATGAATADAAATSTLIVNADQTLRPVTHVASGSLYGLANATTPSDSLVEPIHPSEFVLKPIGGHQQNSGDIGQVWSEASKAGAKVVDRLSDYYAGWPYQFSWSNWDSVVTQQVQEVKATGMTNLAAYALWNEPDGTWQSSNGTFESFWTHTYNLVRSLDTTTPIQGPSFSDNISDMQNFLQNAKNTNTVPDILAWHELSSASKIAGDVAKVESIEDSLGISRRPIDIEEYAAPSEVGLPGPLVGYISKFERLGIHSAELAFWNQSGTLGDLLTSQGGSPNAAYWLYTWYGAMTGNMVVTTPPSQTGIDGFASVPSDKKSLSVVVGGGNGATAVQINGLNSLNLGGSVSVKVEQTTSLGRTVASSGPSTLSTSTYTPSNGSITVPISASTNNAYRITVTPSSGGSGGSTSITGTHRIVNVNSGLSLDTQNSGTTAGTLALQATSSSSSTQSWSIQAAGNGQYKIVDSASGLLLGITNASTSAGADALIWSDNGTADHLWTITSDGAGHYKIKNVNSGLLLGVTNASTAPGAIALQWSDNGTADHLWTLQ